MIAKPDEFEASTKVMESGLLRVLTDEAARPSATGRQNVVPLAPPRRSRLFLFAGIVAAVVLVFDASLFVLHPRRATPPPPAAVAAPMPTYMLVPLDAPPPPAPPAAPAAPAAPATAEATAMPDPPKLAVRSHRHSHHRHGSR